MKQYRRVLRDSNRKNARHTQRKYTSSMAAVSSILLEIIFFFFFICRICSFTPGIILTKFKQFDLNAFGTQKLGDKVIWTPANPFMSGNSSSDLFGNSDLGRSGCDERFTSLNSDIQRETSYHQLVRIDKSFRQQALLQSISEKSILGYEDKVIRIRFGINQGLLPCSLNIDMIASSELESGGLFKDWNFEMYK